MLYVNYPVLKILSNKPFDRAKYANPLDKELYDYFTDGSGSLLAHLQANGRDEKLQRELYLNGSFDRPREMTIGKLAQCCECCHTEQNKLAELIKITDEEKQILERIIAEWTYYETLETTMRRIAKVNQLSTFAEAVNFVYARLGKARVDFKLTNPYLIGSLENRVVEFYQNFGIDRIEETKNVILSKFIYQGLNPLNERFISHLKASLGLGRAIYNDNGELIGYTRGDREGNVFNWAVQRFAWTETGIVEMMAQKETFERSDVPGKEWSGTFPNDGDTRHYYTLNGIVRRSEEMFDVNGHSAWGPMAVTLPAREVCHCKCDLLPAMLDNWNTDREQWTGN